MVDVWATLESAFPTIISYLRETEKEMPHFSVQDVEGWSHLMDALVFEATPITGRIIQENLSRRAYMSAEFMDKQLKNLAEVGYLEKGLEGYTITDKGLNDYQDYLDGRADAYSKTQLLSEEDFNTLIGFLQKGYEAALVTEKPDNKPSMAHGKKFYTHLGGGQLGALLGWINLFELYRDDVHAAAWKKQNLTGIQIETLTKVWRDEALQASELAEQLQHRGYQKHDYQLALDRLVERGLLNEHDENYQMTARGKTVRQQIDEDTNTMFDDFCSQTFSDDDVQNLERIVQAIIE